MINTSKPTKAANAARITDGQNIGLKSPAIRHTIRSGITPTRNFNTNNGSDFTAAGTLSGTAPGPAATIPGGRNRLSIR
ncbi:MAG: hypothetical protein M3Y48_22115 [Actinomycetota bacterium]|nr:hypothetical protein [Actinomycetota bacterium]